MESRGMMWAYKEWRFVVKTAFLLLRLYTSFTQNSDIWWICVQAKYSTGKVTSVQQHSWGKEGVWWAGRHSNVTLQMGFSSDASLNHLIVWSRTPGLGIYSE